MQRVLQRQHLVRRKGVHLVRAVGMSLVLALVWSGTALAQQIRVSGLVTSPEGVALQGVIVGVQETQTRTSTDGNGRYSITAPGDGVLVFSAIGFRPLTVNIAGRTTVDVTLERAVAVLDEIIITGYTEQRRADITGAVSSVDMESVERQTSASVLQRIDGRVAGVTVDASGSPGSRTTVRIRGVSSFHNNDPLYIIDGTPVEDTFMNWLNPNDIESIQVLKDASAASIYGSRATNGVVVIETRKGGRGAEGPRLSIDTRFGVATPVRGYDDFLILDALEYHQIVRRSYENAGQPVPTNIYGDPNNPSIPGYIWPNNCGAAPGQPVQPGVCTESDPRFPAQYAVPRSPGEDQNSLIMPGSPGTNWWDAVFGSAMVSDINLGLSGSGATHGYHVSFNYLNQEGTAAFNRFQRGGARVNTQFERGRFTVGENIAVALEEFYGGAGDPGGFAEGGILGKNILMQPVVPVYDAGGNFAAGKAVGLGNQSNPLKEAWANKDDVGKNIKIFGNVYGGFAVTDELRLQTRFGFNLNEQSFVGFDPQRPELSEPSFSDGINEEYNTFREWTWTNTLRYATTLGERHNLNILLGHEANESRSRFNGSSIDNLVTTDIDARYIDDTIGDPGTKNVNSDGGTGALLSFFGKADYNFADRYHLSLTLRRDGSSRFGERNRWGTFPAFSLGWRLSQEPFWHDRSFTNIMLRFGWGVTGNQRIPQRTLSEYGGSRGSTSYAIGGGDGLSPGYRQTALGNPDLKWEENQSVNLGLDLEFLGGAASLVVDLYQRNTDNLLFAPPVPGTAGVAAPPIVNIGEMKNRGIDFSLGYRGTLGDGSWSVTFNGSHYKNEVVRIDGEQDFFFFGASDIGRYGFQSINEIGHPIGAFYGLIADGFFEDQAAVDAHAEQGGPNGKAPGRIRFRDVNGDGTVNADDRTIIGSPHPDFTAGLDLTFETGAWDFAATVFGSFGNEIWDVQKQFYVFRNFSTNARRDLLTDSWTPETAATAKYPRLDVSDTFSGQQVSSYYIEDGSYLRLRNLQIGYRIPQSWIPNTRIYVQAENLFTITGYPGLDPALPAADVSGVAGDVRDQYRGVDRGAYPSSKTISFGISTSF